jgi:hypothetical protein
MDMNKVAGELVMIAKGLVAGIFDPDDAQVVGHIKQELGKEIAFVSGYVTALGGKERATIMIAISTKPKNEWPNGIFQNTPYSHIRIEMDGTVESFSGSLPKMRKFRVKSIDDAIRKIKEYINKVK